MIREKILSFDALHKKIKGHQKAGGKVVLCYGVFGVLHIGHIRYLKSAKKYGDLVVVVLTPDNYAGNDKKQAYESMRAEALAHLDWVDTVAVCPYDNAEEILTTLRPDVYAKGFESVHSVNKSHQNVQEESLCQNLGIKYVVAEESGFSSTSEINIYHSHISEDILNYIYSFKQRHVEDDLLRSLDELQNMKILVVGDTILDEYQYCTAIGKSSKDPTLAVKYESRDLFPGGVLAVANHVANFAGEVTLLTVLGEDDTYEDFIRSEIKHNVRPLFVFKPGAPTLIKTRFIDGYSTHKLFEVYTMDDSFLGEDQDYALCQTVQQQLPNYDLVIVADYGHGALSQNMITVLSSHAPFLAVNTQSNAGNRGFNTIRKYPKADYVSLAEHEIRLEMRDISGKLFPMVSRLTEEMSCRQFVVTRGKKGCMVVDKAASLIQVPSLSQVVVDRVGAGDAFFAITAMLSERGVSNEILGFIGNVIGSMAVGIMGNKKTIEKTHVKEYISSFLR